MSVLPEYFLSGDTRVTGSEREPLTHVNPATGRAQAIIVNGSGYDVARAVERAHEGLAVWRRWPAAERRRALTRLAQLMGDARGELARVLSLEIGFPISKAPARVDTGISWIDGCAGWSDKVYGEVLPTPGYSNYTSPEPVGVVGVISTWNNSIASFAMTAGPALAAGCSVVLKPSEYAPFGPVRCAELALEAGLPPGVLNVVTGDAATGQALITHPGVAKIAFTGSASVGRSIARTCAETLKPAVLELGGKSAAIICADAPIEAAVRATSRVIIGSGQQCTLGSRLLVNKRIYAEFADRLDQSLRAVRVGDPSDERTEMGPLVSRAALERTLGILDRARSYAQIRTGGARLRGGEHGDGHYLSPTVVCEAGNDSEIAQTELFAPVLTMIAVDDDDEALAVANDSEFALAGYVFSSDINRAHRLAGALDAENVGVNGAPIPIGPGLPFGGSKASGYGKQGGLAGVLEYVRMRSISICLDDPAAPGEGR